MKRILLHLFTIFFCLPMLAEDTDMILRVELNDGTRNDYVIADRPQISFENDKVVFVYKSISTSYLKKDIRNFTFLNKDDTGILELRGGDTRITYTGNSDKIIVEGITEREQIKVYSVSGQQYLVTINYAGSHAEIILTSLPSGYYIINIKDKQSIKILRK